MVVMENPLSLEAQVGSILLVLNRKDLAHPNCLDLTDAEREALFFACYRPGFTLEKLGMYLAEVHGLSMSASCRVRFADNVWSALNLLTLCDYFGYKLNAKGKQVVRGLEEGGW